MPPRKKKDPSTALVPADLETSLAPQRTEAEQFLQAVQGLDLTTQTNRDKAGKLVARIRERIADLKAQREAITGPLNEAKRRVDALFKPVAEYWQSCNVALSDRLLAATEEAEKAQMKALAAVADAGGNTDLATLTVAHDTPRTPEGLQERVSWDAEVIDETAVPQEYKITIVDLATIRALAKASKGQLAIPGVRVFEVKSFAKGR